MLGSTVICAVRLIFVWTYTSPSSTIFLRTEYFHLYHCFISLTIKKHYKNVQNSCVTFEDFPYRRCRLPKYPPSGDSLNEALPAAAGADPEGGCRGWKPLPNGNWRPCAKGAEVPVFISIR